MKTTHNREFEGIPAGLAVRGSIGDEYIYRIRPGNGYYNAVLGQVYQDKYPYFVPSSINNAQGAAARSAFATAVGLWKALSPAEKKALNVRAQKAHLCMSGYNLYIREYVRSHA